MNELISLKFMKKNTFLKMIYRIALFCVLIIINTFNNLYAQKVPEWDWVKNAGGKNQDYGKSLVTDKYGNVYLTGSFKSNVIQFGKSKLKNKGKDDAYIVKYNSIGDVLWSKIVGGTSSEKGIAISTDKEENSYFLGNFESDNIILDDFILTNDGENDIFLVKLDKNSNVIWANSINGNSNELAYSMAIDKNQNVFITGTFESVTLNLGEKEIYNQGGEDIFIIKYDKNGNLLWSKSVGGSGSDYSQDIATDKNGNFYITGYYYSESISFDKIVLKNKGNHDVFVAKYNSNGKLIWVKNAGGSDWDSSLSICVDDEENVFAAGKFENKDIYFENEKLENQGKEDIFLVKYNKNGKLLWAKSSGGSNFDYGTSITTDAHGNLYLTGGFSSDKISFDDFVLTNKGSNNFYMVKFSPKGKVLWAKSSNGKSFDIANEITSDIMGNLYLTGFYWKNLEIANENLKSKGNEDIFLLKLSAVPDAASNLKLSSSNYNEVNLSWTDNSFNETNFEIYRSVNEKNNFKKIASVDKNITNFVDKDVNHNTNIFYKVFSVNNNVKSEVSNISNFVMPHIISLKDGKFHPEVLRIKQGEPVIFKWFDGDNPVVCNDKNWETFPMDEKNISHFLDKNLISVSKVYNFSSAYNSKMKGKIVVEKVKPKSPSDVFAIANDEFIKISWSDNSIYETNFIIERSKKNENSFKKISNLSKNSTEYIDKNILKGQEYEYRLYSANENLFSDFSNFSSDKVPHHIIVVKNNEYLPSNLEIQQGESVKFIWESGSHPTMSKTGDWETFKMDKENKFYWLDNSVINTPQTYDFYCIYNRNKGMTGKITIISRAPNKPSYLFAEAKSSKEIHLKWIDNSSDESSFIIERSNSAFGGFEKIASVSENKNSFYDKNLKENKKYYYRVKSANFYGESSYSKEIALTTLLSDSKQLIANTISSSEIELKWSDNYDNETGFEIYRSNNKNKNFELIEVSKSNETNYFDKNLNPNTKYFYKIKTISDKFKSDFSKLAEANTLLKSPKDFKINSISSNEIRLFWLDNFKNEKGFEIQRSITSQNGFEKIKTTKANETTYSDKKLASNTRYYYNMRVLTANISSDFTDILSAITYPEAPRKMIVKAISSKSIEINWLDIYDNEKAFEIQRSADGQNNFVKIAELDKNITSYIDKDLNPNSVYFYRVRGILENKNSDFSKIVNTSTLLKSPKNIFLEAQSSNTVVINWRDNFDNEDGFEIRRSENEKFGYKKIAILEKDENTFLDKNLKANTKYFYKIRAISEEKNSDFSDKKSVTTYMQAPKNFKAKTVNSMSISMNWDDNFDNEKFFEISRSDRKNGEFKIITKCKKNNTSFIDKNLKANKNYFYKIRVVGEKINSDFSKVIKISTSLIAPSKINVASYSYDKMKITWSDDYSNENGFEIQRSTSLNGNYKHIITTKENVNTFIDENLNPETEYFYKIRTITQKLNSDFTEIKKNITQEFHHIIKVKNNKYEPSSLTIQKGEKIKFQWVEGNHPTVSDNNVWKTFPMDENNQTYWIDTSITNSVGNYSYHCVFFGKKENMSGSFTIQYNTPSAPSNLRVKVISATQIDLNWQDNSNNETKFVIERSELKDDAVSDTDLKELPFAETEENITIFSDKNLKPDSRYFYRVKAINEDGGSEFTEMINEYTNLNAPSYFIARTSTTNSMNLSWTDIYSNETGFEVHRSFEANKNFKQIALTQPNVTSHIDKSLKANTTYYYKIRALSDRGNSEFTMAISSSTAMLPPNNLKVKMKSFDELVLSWDDDFDDELGFEIQRSKQNDQNFKSIKTTNKDVISFNDKNLKSNTKYFYRIRALTPSVNSDFSEPSDESTDIFHHVITVKNDNYVLANLTTKQGEKIKFQWAEGNHPTVSVGGKWETFPMDKNNQVYWLSDENIKKPGEYSYYCALNGEKMKGKITIISNVPASPSNLDANSSSHNIINIKWKDNSDSEEKFILERSVTKGVNGFKKIAELNENDTAYVDTEVKSNMKYYYRIKSSNVFGISDYSTTASTSTLATPPKNLTAEVKSSKKISLNWIDDFNNETGFEVHRSKKPNASFKKIASVGVDSSFYNDETRLKAGMTYYYKVRALIKSPIKQKNKKGKIKRTAFSNIVEVTTLSAAPKNLRAKVISSSQINIVWKDNFDNETDFEIQRSKKRGTNYTTIAKVGENIESYEDKDLKTYTTYFYKVRANTTSGNTDYSTPSNSTTLLAAPSNFDVSTNYAKRIDIRWADKIDTLKSYEVHRAEGKASRKKGGKITMGKFKLLKTIKTTENFEVDESTNSIDTLFWLDKEVKPQTTYYYKLRITTPTVSSEFTKIDSASTLSLPPKNFMAKTIDSKNIKLSWIDDFKKEKGFEIQRSATPIVGFRTIKRMNANDTVLIDRNLNPNKDYYYRIKVLLKEGSSGFTDEITETTMLLEPTNLSLKTINSKEIQINWKDNSKNEIGFEIVRSTSLKGSFKLVTTAEANKTSFIDKDLLPYTEYFYRIKSVGQKKKSNFSKYTSKKTLRKAPSNLKSVAFSSTQINLTWDSNTDVPVAYEIFKSTKKDGSYNSIIKTAIGKNEYKDNEVKVGGTYFYKICVTDAKVNSDTSNFVSATTPQWMKKDKFPGDPRKSAVGFSIGDKGYVGLGDNSTSIYKRDLWEFNPKNGVWTQKANFGGTGRVDAIGFSIGNKGYVGTGYDGEYRKDFWVYDPAKNTWEKIADFEGTPRKIAVGFSIGKKGYVGTGFDEDLNYLRDFWEYEVSTDTWTKKADFGGRGRTGAIGFAIGNKGYIGTGNDENNYAKDFWEYNQMTNRWTKKANFPGGARRYAVGFTIGKFGYIATGYDKKRKYRKDLWKYNPARNEWIQEASPPKSAKPRRYAVAFSIGNRAYIGTGDEGNVRYYNKDFWEFTETGFMLKHNQ